MNWTESIIEVAESLVSHDGYQKRLGKVMSGILKEYGRKAIEEFANELKETYGITRKPETLRNYAYVWNNVGHLNFPDDIHFGCLQIISGTKKPKYWLERIVNEGLSSGEVMRMIRLERGVKPRTMEVICEKCGHINHFSNAGSRS